MSRARVAWTLSLLIVASWPTPAAAQERSPIAGDGCEQALLDAVAAALAVELSTASAEARDGLADGSLEAALACDGPEVVAVVRSGSARSEQHVPREERGLARRLAVSLAEMLDAASTPTATVAADPPPASASLEVPVPPRAPALRLRLGGGAWLGGEPLIAMGTVAAGIEVALVPELAVVVDLSGSFGGVAVTAGTLDARLASAGASLRLGADLDVLRLAAGPALRGGVVLWTGHPREPARGAGRDLAAGWLGLGVVGAAHARLGELPLRIGVELEGGPVVYGSTALAYGELAARVAGAWLEARLVLDLHVP